MSKVEIIIKDTHRGLWYEDGVLTKVLEAGRYEFDNSIGLFGETKAIRVKLCWWTCGSAT